MAPNPQPLTPEEVVLAMTGTELRELLSQLSLDADTAHANRLRRLVAELNSFEDAIEQIAGPPSIKKSA